MGIEGVIRLLCVDDHYVVREGIAAVVNKHPDMQVVAFAANGLEALAAYRRHRPDAVLLDLRMPGMSGLDVIHAVREEDPHACIIVLTMYGGDADIQRAVKAGADAYLLKDTLADNLVQTIRDAYRSRKSATPGDAPANDAATCPTLSPREEEVMRLLASGMRNKEIGTHLGIAEGTVEAHVKKIFAKLQVHDRTAALAVALRRGLVHLE